jgi:hypothetical protein
MIFAAAKAYVGFSARRFTTDLKDVLGTQPPQENLAHQLPQPLSNGSAAYRSAQPYRPSSPTLIDMRKAKIEVARGREV